VIQQRRGFIPVGTINHETSWAASGRIWNSMLGSGVRGFIDEVSATYRPQAFILWSLGVTLDRDWRGGIDLSVSTSIDPQPIDPERYETFASMRLPIYYRFNRNTVLRFGVRGSLRGL
jgi:hypothetical protein